MKNSNEPKKVEAYECPHCKKLYKTKRGITNHIAKCKKNPKFFMPSHKRAIDEKGNVLEKRILIRNIEKVGLFVNGKFSYIVEDKGELPSSIRYPRDLSNVRFENVYSM